MVKGNTLVMTDRMGEVFLRGEGFVCGCYIDSLISPSFSIL